jgi:hypothetical protein
MDNKKASIRIAIAVGAALPACATSPLSAQGETDAKGTSLVGGAASSKTPIALRAGSSVEVASSRRPRSLIDGLNAVIGSGQQKGGAIPTGFSEFPRCYALFLDKKTIQTSIVESLRNNFAVTSGVKETHFNGTGENELLTAMTGRLEKNMTTIIKSMKDGKIDNVEIDGVETRMAMAIADLYEDMVDVVDFMRTLKSGDRQ